MADPLDSHTIARRSFDVGRKGYEQQEVRAFLHEIGSLVDRLQREAQQLRERAERAEARLGLSDKPDEGMLLEILGEETTRVLSSARDAAAEIRAKADAAAERIISEATGEAAEARAEAVRDADRRRAEAGAESDALLAEARTELERRRAEADEAAERIREAAAEAAQALRDEGQRDLERIHEEAEAELEAARARGRDMVAEAQAVRERVLRDLAVRRKKARQQVEKLNAGRERLLQAYDVVRGTIDEATSELSTSLSDARLAADAAARRIAEEPEPTLEQLDEEVANAGLVDLPITDVSLEPDADADADADARADDGDVPIDADAESDTPGPFSGEVPAVVVAEDPPVPSEPDERRGRKGRRRKETFEGLPASAFSKVEPPAEGEGIRILAEPTEPTEPEEDTAVEETVAEDAPVEDDAVEDAAVEETGGEDAAVEETGGEDATESDAPAEAAADDDADAAPPAVDDVFARLRAERGAADESVPDGEATEEPEPEPEPSEAEAEADAPSAPTPFSERDAALESIDKDLARRLKRALADEQNDVLDRLRRIKPKGVDDLLPEPDAHAARWSEVVAEPLGAAATAGATWAGGTAGSAADLADELARSLTAPLRERIDRSFVASDGNLDDVADRVRALYREWKGQRLTDTSRHYAAAAYARGVYDGLPADASVQWTLDPTGGPCPDCDDNVLGGALAKGGEFPTGHQLAPAHPGCRCLVLAAEG